MTDVLSFSKFQGCGNDFICIDCRDFDYSLHEIAQHLCHRRLGIGADGLIGLFHSHFADIKMVIVNQDGSIPEMCGNGLRCLVAFAKRIGVVNQSCVSVETGAGVLSCQIISKSSQVDEFCVEMGRALFAEHLPVNDFHGVNQSLITPITDLVPPIECIPVSMGNPHAVVFVDDVSSVPIQEIGPSIESSSLFPNHANVEFVEVLSHSRLSMRVWERGVGETMACGTGACASVVAGVLTGRCDPKTVVQLPGGSLEITFNPDTHAVSMTGPADHVFFGSIQL